MSCPVALFACVLVPHLGGEAVKIDPFTTFDLGISLVDRCEGLLVDLIIGAFVVFFVVLGYLGIKPPSDIGTLVSQVGTLFYFAFFLLMPWWTRIGEFKPVPDRVVFTPH